MQCIIETPGGGGGYSDISHLQIAWTIYFGLRFSVQNFEIQYFLGGFQKMNILGGMNKIVDIFGGSLHNWTNSGVIFKHFRVCFFFLRA